MSFPILTPFLKPLMLRVKLGKDIKDMSDFEVEEEVITREKMLRVSGQLYKNLEYLFGSCSFNWKLLTAMCLEITTPQELTLDIAQRDPQLVRQVKEMIKELRFVHQINPYRRAWVNMEEKLIGFCVNVDGSKPAYAAKVFCLTRLTVGDSTRISSNLIQGKSKLSRRNVIINKSVGRILGNNLLQNILDGICWQLRGAKLQFYSVDDSISALFSFHEGTKLNNTLMVNTSQKFYYTSQKLVEGCEGLFQASF